MAPDDEDDDTERVEPDDDEAEAERVVEAVEPDAPSEVEAEEE